MTNQDCPRLSSSWRQREKREGTGIEGMAMAKFAEHLLERVDSSHDFLGGPKASVRTVSSGCSALSSKLIGCQREDLHQILHAIYYRCAGKGDTG